jgi:hypothetical protein
VAATKHGRCWQEHEGRVVPLFADGAEGVGASSARGVLVARRPNDGRRKGDRVRRGIVLASSPARLCLGRRVMYRRQDMDRWLTEQQQAPSPRR